MFLLSKVAGYFNGGTSSVEERKLLVKIDWFVLSFCCLLYWVNYLDRLNLSNAYVSGMKEDLNMKGDDLNLINTCFNIGYIVALVPHNIILLKVRPRYWLPFCSFSWGLLTLGMYKVTSYKQLCVIRFFQATFEASTFSGCHLILASWYTESELAKRSAIFTSSGLIGNIFSSTMQASIYENMDMKNGLAGWRWLFIIDFIITVPITIYGLICFPDTPDTCQAFYFNDKEIALAKSRMKVREKTKMDWSVFKRVLGRWHWYLFSFLWVLGGENESFATNSLFSLWLQYFNYTVPQRNHYPMGVYAIGVLGNFICCYYIDLTKGKYHWRAGLGIACMMLISTILLTSNPLSKSHVFAAHYLSGFAYSGQAVFFAWANVVCYNDLEERAIVLASMNMFSNAVNAWWSLLFYGASTAPKFKKGCYAMFATVISSAIVICAMRYLQLREEKRQPEEEMSPTESESGASLTKGTNRIKVDEVSVHSSA
ncbi:putative pantothenate transporter [Clavispora lusitaniae]|uniref:Pantothenate transporter n=1 Tax=Clavispora lusitaniae TaxID=36911 RepID=A0ACD0WH54_CLALS|nr:putative pantothenate transporter [Clavispora lusitaniae]QFZ32455.1 putative pantothenate transporter [Clavispora lusitaniae]QFZ38124.1 putative pantothenate transporter [Clavispora lusitaniae]QFZ43807.1 putative pantothenate transporter [Clavispora lusitaniae]QFZ49484.1 putative pantothenate transporter [Clavispora lusitaniae]